MSKTHILLLSVNQFHFYFIWFHLRSEGSSRLRIQQKVARLVVPRTTVYLIRSIYDLHRKIPSEMDLAPRFKLLTQLTLLTLLTLFTLVKNANGWWVSGLGANNYWSLNTSSTTFHTFLIALNLNEDICTWCEETKCQAGIENCWLIGSNLKLKIRNENWKWKSAKLVCWTWKLSSRTIQPGAKAS